MKKCAGTISAVISLMYIHNGCAIGLKNFMAMNICFSFIYGRPM